MPRANRYIVAGPAYHVTHRCHNRVFLLKFAKDRDTYRETLRRQLAARRALHLLTYCITSNHVHLLLTSSGTDAAVSSLMQALEGDFAGHYNRRKKRSGAFWSGRFHATMIDSGAYLWQCMRYIELNMVRAGVVRHPRDWPWTGFSEIMGIRRRYLAIDLQELLKRTEQTDLQRLRAWYEGWISDIAAAEAMNRQAQWTESIAVGSRRFVEGIGRTVETRMKVAVEESESGIWVVKEASSTYSLFSDSENASKTPKTAISSS